ncbi:MAG: hypothetical protein ACU0BK_18270 [Shimia sp.]|uniref:hypothetical protein n=1 Tax=Shimia sp. TaxID=1954381 RepID=UPI004059E4DC
MRQRFADYICLLTSLRGGAAPLVSFVHVPKAAGSSINSHLQRWSPRGLTHVERFESGHRIFDRAMARADWISGHLSWEKMQGLTQRVAPGRQVRWFGAMRDPVDHVAAHYNWMIEIRARGERFYAPHSSGIKAASASVRKTDHTDPRAVVTAIASTPALFANLQSRFLIGDDIAPDHAEADRRLAGYELIVPIADLEQLAQVMTGKPPRANTRANVSRWHFDRAVFQDPQVKNFLREFNARDEALFDRISA